MDDYQDELLEWHAAEQDHPDWAEDAVERWARLAYAPFTRRAAAPGDSLPESARSSA